MTDATPLDTHSRARLTVANFELLADAGAFIGHSRVELIEGDILIMNALFRPHAYAHSELMMRLRIALDALGIGLTPLIAPTVPMPPDSAPEPDIVVTREPKGSRGVPLASVQLIVEIADASAGFDLATKAALYARNAVPEYWVVSLKDRHVHQHWAPEQSGYGQRRLTPFGDPLTAATIAGLTIATDTLD